MEPSAPELDGRRKDNNESSYQEPSHKNVMRAVARSDLQVGERAQSGDGKSGQRRRSDLDARFDLLFD